MSSPTDKKRGNADLEDLERLAEEIAGCTRCDLHLSRTHVVSGEGPAPAVIMCIGEAPGKKEDELGRPFVGRAGSILTGLLSDAGIQRDQAFITSVVKCRPPGNRDPKREEISACKHFLFRQIGLVRPRVIVPMGRFATSVMMDFFGIPFTSFSSARRREFPVSFQGYTLCIVPVYHPAVITHNPTRRGDLEDDFSYLKEVLKSTECDYE
ncbi:MAG TPA: uracil-DNA glycosylase [Methanoregulaceae archaeon]|jgi:DNA polymerase|nr:uracil-DNA glycosylase [Methanoregulaceae archaeon]